MNRPYLGMLVALAAAGLLAFAVNQERWLSVSEGKEDKTTVEIGLSTARTCEIGEDGQRSCTPVDYAGLPHSFKWFTPAIYWGGLGAALLLVVCAALAFAGIVLGRLVTPPLLALLASIVVTGGIVALLVVAGHVPSGADLGILYGGGGGVLGILGAATIAHWHKFGAMTGVSGGRAEISRWDEGRGRTSGRAEAKLGRGPSSLNVPAPARLGEGPTAICATCGTRTHREDGRPYCELCQKFV